MFCFNSSSLLNNKGVCHCWGPCSDQQCSATAPAHYWTKRVYVIVEGAAVIHNIMLTIKGLYVCHCQCWEECNDSGCPASTPLINTNFRKKVALPRSFFYINRVDEAFISAFSVSINLPKTTFFFPFLWLHLFFFLLSQKYTTRVYRAFR